MNLKKRLSDLKKRAKQNLRLRHRNTPRHHYERVLGMPRHPHHQYNSLGNHDPTMEERILGGKYI